MKTILITGASRGIGAETALVLARAGHHVLATMRNPGPSSELSRRAEQEGLRIEVAALDVDQDDVDRVITALGATHGPIDVLVNNAGIALRGSIEEQPLAEMRATFETNLFGVIRCTKAVLPAMRARGSGDIINISSVSGRLVTSPLGVYCASKFAIEAISEALAQEVHPFGIRVSVLEPGTMDTDMLRSLTTDRGQSIYPTEGRLARFFSAAVTQATRTTAVGETILEILAGSSSRFRHPVGDDARGAIAHRASLTDEEWIRSVSEGVT